MKRKSLFGVVIATAIAVFTQSCDSDFNEIGAGIFGDDGFGFESYSVQNLNASIVNTGEVSTRNLPVNNLGVYNDAVFGNTTAHFVTQLEMSKGTEFTSISNNPVIDSVYVYIPYNSSIENTDSDGNTTYKLNNVYGNGTFTLNVFENGYLLRNFDPNNNLDTQEYYSSDKLQFDSNKKGIAGGRLNNSTATAQNTNFKINDQEILLYKYDKDGVIVNDSNNNPTVKERKKPGIWLDLDKAYFQNAFFANDKYKSILNNTVLKEYFRGLYFNVQANGNQNALAQLNIAGGEFVIVYKGDKSATDITRERKTVTLKMGYSTDLKAYATTVNLIENENSDDYSNALTSNVSNPLWIKGNNGSIATISLFGADADGNGVADELETIKENDWLINQAVLTVFVDKSVQTNNTDFQPNRLIVYDAKNNTTLVDYNTDATTSPVKNIYNGIMDISTDNNTIKYRFRITNHVNNLIKRDSTNVVLGLAVTNDISLSTFNVLKNEKTSFNTKISKIPTGSVTSPFGTILYGPNHSDVSTRMKLDLFYTKKTN
ncbi:DUF4270 domain-containing protein [Flavobacterium sp. I3-2]|uniref:DUF4270 domain-containing protein n=1 Tax=Flavobacterium sp. I3-2 TaxID=2748319 RepID=UPI0015A76DB5|nr:DUF4270 domain-containing protein [Flavobacterium sp. I3-2]